MQAAPPTEYTLCIAINGIDTMSCALNRTAKTHDQRLPNGLCGSADGSYYQNICTISTGTAQIANRVSAIAQYVWCIFP